MKKIVLVLIVLVIGLMSFNTNRTVSNYSDESIKKIAFSQTLSKAQVYLLMGRPISASITKYSKEYKISQSDLRRVMTAMIILETGHLKSNALQVNNLTGIKAIKSRPSFTFMTTEFVNGQMIKCNQEFSSFFSFEDSLDNLFLVWRNKRYAKLHSVTSLSKFIEALGKSGYATDPEYGAKITRISKEF